MDCEASASPASPASPPTPPKTELQPATQRVIIAFDVGIKNLAVCILSVQEKECTRAEVVSWKIISLAEPKEKIPGIQELTGRLYLALDEFLEHYESTAPLYARTIDTVVIENQPSRLNGSMKTIQVLLYGYFQLRRHWEGYVKSTQMVAPTQKLLNHAFEIPEYDGKSHSRYQATKWKGIQCGTVYIKDCQNLVKYVSTHKKKDDLYDSLLHGVAWLRKQGYQITSLQASPTFELTV
jgi:hypothetical protein